LDQFVRGAQVMMHSAVLLKAEVKALQEANQAKKRRARKRKVRIQHRGSLTIQEGEELVQEAGIGQVEGGGIKETQSQKGQRRRCRLCNQVGHNVTYRISESARQGSRSGNTRFYNLRANIPTFH
jgi:hypothetical protein